MLHGERPYWWVHATSLYAEDGRPTLTQFSLTCETGPGEILTFIFKIQFEGETKYCYTEIFTLIFKSQLCLNVLLGMYSQ